LVPLSLSAAGAKRHREPFNDIIDQPYSSVQQRDYFVSAQMKKIDQAYKLHPSTPDLVHSLNQLNISISLPAIRDAHKGNHGDERWGACLRPCFCQPRVSVKLPACL
jgi:hypothetical protein